MELSYKTKGVCAGRIDVKVEDGIVKDVVFHGGCDGNHSGIVRLVKNRPAAEVAEALRGTTCGMRKTSCPDQLALAIEAALEAENSGR